MQTLKEYYFKNNIKSLEEYQEDVVLFRKNLRIINKILTNKNYSLRVYINNFKILSNMFNMINVIKYYEDILNEEQMVVFKTILVHMKVLPLDEKLIIVNKELLESFKGND